MPVHREFTWALDDLEVSAQIVNSRVDEVESMRRGRECHFDWDTSLYSNPQRRVAPTVMEMTPTERAEYNRQDSNHYPFWVAEVGKLKKTGTKRTTIG